MIIICSGPDTYRAREKARDLVTAFRTKHDPRGLATEVVVGSEGLEVLLSRLAGTSLFSPKKMIRADGCLARMKIADVRTLAAKLESDKDQTIIVTVEAETPNAKTLDALNIAPLFHYPFLYQSGNDFCTWVRERAAQQNVSQQMADTIAEYTEGDSWYAMQELAKQAANPHKITLNKDPNIGSVFDVADRVMSERQGWRNDLDALEDDNAISIFVSQARSFIRVRDGQAAGLHPYVAKKLGLLRATEPVMRMRKFLRALLASRVSLASGNETENLL